MKHELKIVITCEDESIDNDGKPLSIPIIYLDDVAIGCVQNFVFKASSENIVPEIEFTFPNLRDKNIDPIYYNATSTHYPLVKDIDYHIESLSKIDNIQIKLQNLNNQSNIVNIREIGTDGFIDSIPMIRRHQ